MNAEGSFSDYPPGEGNEFEEIAILEAALLEGIHPSHREYGEHILDDIRKVAG